MKKPLFLILVVLAAFAPALLHPVPMSPLVIKRDIAKGKIFSHIRNDWFVEYPEETVRQEFVCSLVNDYGYAIDQMSEELSTSADGSMRKRTSSSGARRRTNATPRLRSSSSRRSPTTSPSRRATTARARATPASWMLRSSSRTTSARPRSGA